MTFVLSQELLEKYAGVISNIMCCIYRVDPRSAYRQLNKQIYKETAPLCYDIY